MKFKILKEEFMGSGIDWACKKLLSYASDNPPKKSNGICYKYAIDCLKQILLLNKPCTLCLGCFIKRGNPKDSKVSLDNVSHAWVECDNEVYESNNPNFNGFDRITLVKIEFIPSDLNNFYDKLKASLEELKNNESI